MPILQGTRSRRGEVLRHDLSFRPALTKLKMEWQRLTGVAGPADGFVVIHDLKLPRIRATYSRTFLNLYETTLKQVATAVKQPLQYSGLGEWSVFT